MRKGLGDKNYQTTEKVRPEEQSGVPKTKKKKKRKRRKKGRWATRKKGERANGAKEDGKKPKETCAGDGGCVNKQTWKKKKRDVMKKN